MYPNTNNQQQTPFNYNPYQLPNSMTNQQQPLQQERSNDEIYVAKMCEFIKANEKEPIVSNFIDSFNSTLKTPEQKKEDEKFEKMSTEITELKEMMSKIIQSQNVTTTNNTPNQNNGGRK